MDKAKATHANGEQLHEQQVKQLQKHVPIGIAATVINSLILTLVLWPVTPHANLTIWLIASLLFSFIKLLVHFPYLRSSPEPSGSRRDEMRLNIGLGISGLIWGSTAIVLFPTDTVAHQSFVAFVLGGMVAGAAGTHSVIIKSFLVFSVPALVPVIARFFAFGDQVHFAMGGMTLLFGLLMFLTGIRLNTAVRSSLKLRFENRDLIHRLEDRVKERTFELQKANEDLIASEQKFRHLVEYAPAGIYEIDFVNRRFKSVNEAMCQFLGYSEEELLSMNPFDLLDEDGKREFAERMRRRLAGEKVDEAVEYRITNKSGRKLWVNLNTALTYENGRVSGALVIAYDITERKRVADLLHRSRDELELRVRERTAQLERKNQELQEFVFVASHDLSEPLRKIQVFGTLLEESYADLQNARVKDYVSRMTGAASRMQELLNALLKYSRIESKGQDFRYVRLNDVAEDAAADLKAHISKIGARVEIGSLPIVVGDSNQLRQLFQHIIANALKYHRPEVTCRIKIYREENGGACRILVEDNGIGFDEKYLDKIFQPFQRLHGRNEYSGIGMGLAICKKIVDRHSGTITARSTPGKGSTFIVTLPFDSKPHDN